MAVMASRRGMVPVKSKRNEDVTLEEGGDPCGRAQVDSGPAMAGRIHVHGWAGVEVNGEGLVGLAVQAAADVSEARRAG